MFKDQVDFNSIIAKILYEHNSSASIKTTSPKLNKYDEKLIEEYFNNIFENLLTRSELETDNKTITKLTFSLYLELPKIVSDKIFDAFNLNMVGQSNNLSKENFTKGMSELYFDSPEVLMKIIFTIWDFSQKGIILIEDVFLFMMHLNNKDLNSLELLEENIIDLLLNLFEEKKTLSIEEFIDTIKNKYSDLFLIL
jgi:hypothetical protein